MYLLKRDSYTSNLLLYREDLEVFILPDKSYIIVEYDTGDRVFQKEFKLLEDFLREVKNTLDFSFLDIKLKTPTSLEQILYDNQETSTEFIKSITILYEQESYNYEQGLSNYSYVQDYLPKWSTAYKNTYSAHVKTLEPVFTEVLNVEYNVSNYVEGKPLQSIKNALYYIRDPETTLLSNTNIEGYHSNTKYILNSDTTIRFYGISNIIYISLKDLGGYQLRIKGIFEDSFIEEDIYVSGLGIHRLNLEYSSIYSINIEKVDYGESNNTLYISNVLEISEFNYLKRVDKNIDSKDAKIIVTDILSKDKTVFINTLPYSSSLILDRNDNLLGIYDNILYSCKLNCKLNLDIPQNITYNNTKYIETTYLNENEYEICLDIGSYIFDIEVSLVSICIENSLKERYYLTEDTELVLSETPIFFDSSKVNPRVTFNIDIDNLVEYVIVSISDQDYKHKKANLITQPHLEYIPNLYIKPKEKLLLIKDQYHLLDFDSNILTPLVLNSNPTSLKDSTDYSYYYLTSETYPITTESEDTSIRPSDFTVKLLKTKYTYSLPDVDQTSGIGSILEVMNSKPVIKYTRHNSDIDTFSGIGIDSFNCNSRSVVKYTRYSLDMDTYSSLSNTSLKITSKKFPIVSYTNKEDTTTGVSNFNIRIN